MRGGVARFGSIALGAVLTLVGCGGEGEERLDRAAFLARGNALCTEAERAILTAADNAFVDKNVVPGPEQIDAFVTNTFIPEIEKELDGLKELKPPEDDQDRVNEIIRAGEDALEKVNNETLIIASEQRNPFVDFEELANGYGLRACGEISGKTRRLMSGVPG